MITQTQITVERLMEVGFVDQANNGMCYRMEMPGGLMEIAWYCKVESKLRFQTIRSGVTMKLEQVTTMEHLGLFYLMITGLRLNK